MKELQVQGADVNLVFTGDKEPYSVYGQPQMLDPEQAIHMLKMGHRVESAVVEDVREATGARVSLRDIVIE